MIFHSRFWNKNNIEKVNLDKDPISLLVLTQMHARKIDRSFSIFHKK